MELTKRLLEQFLAVVEEQNFRRAAERLSMKQPPLSQAIQRLERGIGVPLFVREPHGVRVTEAGARFATEAQRILRVKQAALDSTRQAAQGLGCDLRAGYVTALALRYLPHLLASTAREMPDLRIELHQSSSADVAALVQSGALDVGFIREPSHIPADMASVPIAVERLAAVLPARHRLAGMDTIALEDLSAENFVLPDATSLPTLAQQVNLACMEAGFIPRALTTAANLTALLSYVASGMCVSILPEATFELAPAGVAAVPLQGNSPLLDTRIIAVHRPDAGSAVRRLLELIDRQVLDHGRLPFADRPRMGLPRDFGGWG
ncbi:LysR substrate-binding domain-containing protein [Streptomyces sp. NPDC057686]|uniref:LysR substrate-binding domain-containing protein n=1 Tax=Streptomyces sp. NPDC057686 TaxID=3346212 RepID=UPI0036A91030